MSILHADNFSIYGTDISNMTDGVYAEANCQLVTDPDGLSSGHVLSCSYASVANTTYPFRYVFQNGETNTAGASFRIWYSALPNENGAKTKFQFKNEANSAIAYLWFTSTGQVAVSLSGGSTYTSPAPAITAAGWYHIEWKYVLDSSVSFEVKIEGQSKLSQTDVVGSGDPPAQFDIQRNNISINHTVYVKDFVIWDALGTENNDFLGSVLVTTLATTSDVGTLEWVPYAGTTAWDILDNVPPDDDEYISAGYSPIPAPYVATMSNLPDETTSVKALVTFVRAAKSDGGDGSLQVSLISHPDDVSPATIDGSDRPITVAQTYWRDVFEQDPFTDAPWLPQSVNDAQLKINRTT